MDTHERLKRYISFFGRKYPNAWKMFDKFRAKRHTTPAFEWAEWCFCPIAGSYAIVSQGSDEHLVIDRLQDVGILSGLAAWRATQGIYRFDPTVFEALWKTPVGNEIPTELFYRLPEWCCYIETPNQPFLDFSLKGFFVFLEDDRINKSEEVRLILDTGNTLVPLVIILHKNVTRLVDSVNFLINKGFVENFSGKRELILNQVKSLLSVILYLCSLNNEKPQIPVYNTRKKRIYPPAEPRLWEVAVRLGAAIREAKKSGQNREQNQRTGRAHTRCMRPHIRRAHWHRFWIGPRNGERKLVYKWLPPISVKTTAGEIIPTIRPIKVSWREKTCL